MKHAYRSGTWLTLMIFAMANHFLLVNRMIEAAEPSEEKQIDLLKTFHKEFVRITPGQGRFPAEFEMGSTYGESEELPVHKVKLTDEFWVAKYEVPQNLYQSVMGTNPSKWKGPRNSVEMMDFRDAVKFCQRATSLMREAKLLSDKEEIRLPSEAEWEYCCRAGTQTEYSFGDEARNPGDEDNKAGRLDQYGWHTGNAAGNDPPVGALKPNPWGLYDMHGYLWEFVANGWSNDYKDARPDGHGDDLKELLADDAKIVLRGGSWKDRFDRLRSATRRPASNSLKDDAVGFRCVKARVKPK